MTVILLNSEVDERNYRGPHWKICEYPESHDQVDRRRRSRTAGLNIDNFAYIVSCVMLSNLQRDRHGDVVVALIERRVSDITAAKL